MKLQRPEFLIIDQAYHAKINQGTLIKKNKAVIGRLVVLQFYTRRLAINHPPSQ